MDAKSRAEKIHQEFHGKEDHRDSVHCLAFIFAQIVEAEREAYEKTKATWKEIEAMSHKAGYAEGYAAARDQAARIIESTVGPRGVEIPITYTKIFADLVRQMKGGAFSKPD